jgi:hypothetical protein
VWKDLGTPSGVSAVNRYATAPGGTLEEDSWNASTGWSGFVNRGGTIAGTPQAVSDEVTGNLEIYAAGPSGTAQEIAYKADATWTGWFNLGGNLTG